MCLGYIFNRNPKNALWKHVGAVDFNGKFEEILRRELKIDASHGIEISSNIDIPSKVSVLITKDEKITDKLTILLKGGMCKNCSKMLSRRFDAVIQLRTIKLKSKNPLQVLSPILTEIIDLASNIQNSNPEQFISDIDEFTHGFNLKLSNKAIMNSLFSYLTRKYPIIVKTSKKLIGKNPNTGGELYRTYLLLRYLPLTVNSLIRIKNDNFQVKKIQSNRIILENISNHKQQTHHFDFFEKKLVEIIEE